jgi:hypothetical protein
MELAFDSIQEKRNLNWIGLWFNWMAFEFTSFEEKWSIEKEKLLKDKFKKILFHA